ncbi:MAG: Lrp/AsnC ligand binding domain-containing protein [Nanoarchaeota archaeon]|nr:Lrp/AsnC ligand binding domain-containing protein [Nanoarchaeota archaeon]
MQLSYLLIKTHPGSEHNVGQELLKMDTVTNVNLLYGKFDLIVKVETGSQVELHEDVLSEIEGITGVTMVKNLLVNHES